MSKTIWLNNFDQNTQMYNARSFNVKKQSLSKSPYLGFNKQRLKYSNNLAELIMVEALFEEMGESLQRVFHLLANFNEFRELSSKEKILVVRGFVSAIQWTGSPVGSSFLREVVTRLGGSLDLSLDIGLTSSDSERRARAALFVRRQKELSKFDKNNN